MGFKKKLTMGAMSATLGLTLVAGGTWAAFNDVEEVEAGVAAGTLDLVVGEHNGPFNFDVSNLKPGDSMTRFIKLDNNGSLAIKEVLMAVENVEFNDYLPADGDPDTYGSNSAIEYLDQFKVTLLRTGIEGNDEEIISSSEDITLADLYNATNLGDSNAISKVGSAVDDHWEGNRVNLASAAQNQWTGIPVNPPDYDTVKFSIEFINDTTTNGGVMEQNKYQGDEATVTFSLEATQWQGQDVSGVEGSVESNKQANNGN